MDDDTAPSLVEASTAALRGADPPAWTEGSRCKSALEAIFRANPKLSTHPDDVDRAFQWGDDQWIAWNDANENGFESERFNPAKAAQEKAAHTPPPPPLDMNKLLSDIVPLLSIAQKGAFFEFLKRLQRRHNVVSIGEAIMQQAPSIVGVDLWQQCIDLQRMRSPSSTLPAASSSMDI